MSHWRHGMLSLLRSERVFRAVGAGCVLAAIIMLALALAGCEEGGISATQAGWRMPTRSFGEDLASSGICRRFDPITGNLVEEVIVGRTSNPNAAFVAALENVANTGLSKIPNPAVAAMMAAKPEDRAAMMARSQQGQMDIAHCIGLANPNVKMPLPPDPTPPAAQAPQGDDDHPSLMPLPQSGQSGQSAHEPVPLPHAHPGQPQHPSSEPLG